MKRMQLVSLALILLTLSSCAEKSPVADTEKESETEAITKETVTIAVPDTTEEISGAVPDTTVEISTSAETQKDEILKEFKVNVIKKESPISREQGKYPTLAYYGWPTVAVDENEVTYVVVSKRLRHIDPYGKVMLYKSTDKGLTWDAGTCLIDTCLDDRDSGILYLGNGRFIVTTFSHNAELYKNNTNTSWTKWQNDVGSVQMQKVYDLWKTKTEAELTGCSSYIISDDYGQTWSAPKLMPITAPHGPTQLNNGDVMYLGVPKASVFASGENLASAVYCYISHDKGETFEKFSTIPMDSSWGACEAHGIQLDDGTIVASVRTGSFHTLISRSGDNGKTWSEVEDVTYGAPAHLIQASNGVVLLTYSKRDDKTGQCVRFSYDSGRTWSKEFYISRPSSSTDTDLGYPATAQYKDGTFITVFYQKYGSDSKPSLLRTIWEFAE